MTRRVKARQNRLAQLEAEFEPLLLSCLREAVNGRYGLFGQNDPVDPDRRYCNWPEADRLVDMAEEIQGLRREAGESNRLAERLLQFKSSPDSNPPGEPKLGKKLLEDIHI